VRIKRLGLDDYEKMVKLWSKSNLPFKPQGRDSKQAIAERVEANRDFFIGAFENGQMVGAVVLTSDLRRGWINRLAVDPDCRRRGVAKALIAESEKTLRKRGLRIFCALIEDSNEASKIVFRKCGYVEHRDIIYFSKRESSDV
jgi:ribosomal protein S18 acetylase RimI-like enzyme